MMRKVFSSEGFTLTEILVSLSITSVLSLLIGFFMTRQSRQADFLRYRFNMQEIYDRVENAVLSKTILSYSTAINNVELFNCLNENSLEPCITTDPGAQVPLFLYDLPPDLREDIRDSASLGLSSTELEKYRLTGSHATPARFDFKTARPCEDGSQNCELEVRAYFWATCHARDDYLDPVNAASDSGSDSFSRFNPSDPALAQKCDEAKSIHIRYQIRHVRGPKSKLPFNLPAVPIDDVFGSYSSSDGHFSSGAVTIVVNTVPPPTLRSFNCAKNMYLTKIEDGVPTCECRFPFSLDSTGKFCQINSGDRCDFGERYRGNDPDTGRMICQKVYCEKVEISKGCGKGGWIEGIKNNFWSEYVAEHIDKNLEGFNYGPELNACAVMTDLCDIQASGESCHPEILCNQTINCCYETEPERTADDGDDPYFGSLILSSKIQNDLLPAHKKFLEGGQTSAQGSDGYEGTICTAHKDCGENDYDPRSNITYDLLCCPSGADTSEKRCRRAVYQSNFDYSVSKQNQVCPTTCHDKMDPNTMDPNTFSWFKSYCSSLGSVNRETGLQEEKDLDAFIKPDDPEEYNCYSHKDPFLRISHEECRGWGYKWGETGHVGCCDNKCISNFEEFEGEPEDSYDKVCNFDDNCDEVSNPDQSNLDWDALGYACDACDEDYFLTNYVSSCGCLECPYSESDNDIASGIENISEPSSDVFNCDNYLCYDKEFTLLHYAPGFRENSFSDSNWGYKQLYGIEIRPTLEVQSFMGDRFFTLADSSLVNHCNSNLNDLPCEYYSDVSSKPSTEAGKALTKFKFVRKNKPGNLTLSLSDIENEKNIKAIMDEKMIDGGDLLDLELVDPCDGNKSCGFRASLQIFQYAPVVQRFLFSNSTVEETKNSFLISILPISGSTASSFADENTTLNLRLGSHNGKMCAGPFALKLAGPSAEAESKGAKYGKFDGEERWLHHGEDYSLKSGGNRTDKILGMGSYYKSSSNPVNEIFLSKQHSLGGAYAYRFWACVSQ